jgi:hypothetical protein
MRNLDQGNLVIFVLVARAGLLALPAGAAAAWLHPDTGDPKEVCTGRIRQGTLAGAVGGLVLTMIGPIAVVVVIGPLAGATAGALSGVNCRRSPAGLACRYWRWSRLRLTAQGPVRLA